MERREAIADYCRRLASDLGQRPEDLVQQVGAWRKQAGVTVILDQEGGIASIAKGQLLHLPVPSGGRAEYLDPPFKKGKPEDGGDRALPTPKNRRYQPYRRIFRPLAEGETGFRVETVSFVSEDSVYPGIAILDINIYLGGWLGCEDYPRAEAIICRKVVDLFLNRRLNFTLPLSHRMILMGKLRELKSPGQDLADWEQFLFGNQLQEEVLTGRSPYLSFDFGEDLPLIWTALALKSEGRKCVLVTRDKEILALRPKGLNVVSPNQFFQLL